MGYRNRSVFSIVLSLFVCVLLITFRSFPSTGDHCLTSEFTVWMSTKQKLAPGFYCSLVIIEYQLHQLFLTIHDIFWLLTIISDRSPNIWGHLPIIFDRSPIISDRLLIISHISPLISDRSSMISDRLPIMSGHPVVISDRSPIISGHPAIISNRLPMFLSAYQ